jgi:protein-S-isoprenylcysteine O-methyltransferase Ste14
VLTAPYEQAGAGVGFWALFVAFALGEAAMRLRSRLGHREGRRVAPWSQAVVSVAVVGSVLGGVGLAPVRVGRIEQGRWLVFGLGLFLMAVGIYIRQWAIVTLGRYFTANLQVHPDQRVVDHGPYRWVHHPSYTGLIAFLAGFGCGLTSWLSVVLLLVVPTASLVLRIRAEEKALVRELGAAYRRYAASRRRLVPGVW